LLDAAGLSRTLKRMALEIAELVPADERPFYIVGVRTGGAYLAQRIVGLLVDAGEPRPFSGAVDITLYRDDVFRGLPKPEIGPTDLGEPIDGRTIVLVDDVLYTGRTVRAAMDVLADYGRPRAVKLAALVDRGRRELPIQPDVVGVTVETSAAQSVRVLLAERGEPDRVVLRERRV
jgi:pyrimidine operon attenuation protein / uracil phosphoribosyltransferase